MIDAHCHLSDPRLESMAAEVVSGLRAAGMRRVILGGVNPDEWRVQESLSKNYPDFVVPVMGIHPWTVRDTEDTELEPMFRLLEEKSGNLSILGEMGLDFHRDNSPAQKAKQTKWCERQLRLAAALNKPVVLHVVRGHNIMLTLLRDIKGLRGLIHGFTGSSQIAKQYIDLGFVLSLGARTFQHKKQTDFSWLGQGDFVLESDAPDYKKPPASATNVVSEWIETLTEASRFLASLWNIPEAEVWKRSRENLAHHIRNMLA
ncbi:MAG: TatD family hydrolase [Pseudomonadota bacterium]